MTWGFQDDIWRPFKLSDVLIFHGRESRVDIKIVDPLAGELDNDTPCETSGYGYSQYVLGQPGVIASTLQWTPLRCITNDECKKTWKLQTLTSRQQALGYKYYRFTFGHAEYIMCYIYLFHSDEVFLYFKILKSQKKNNSLRNFFEEFFAQVN